MIKEDKNVLKRNLNKDLKEKYKRICKVLILLLISVNNFAQIDVEPKAAFEYGINDGFRWVLRQPYNPMGFITSNSYNEFGNFRTKTAIEFSYGNVSLEFDNHFYMKKDKGFEFSPTRADFFVNLSYKISDKVKIYSEHLCTHPVISQNIRTNNFNGGYTSFGISYGY